MEFYFSSEGKMPGYEYYSDLDEAGKRRFFVVVGHFAESSFGTIFPKVIYNIEDKNNGIYVLKPSAHRFFCFTTADRKLIITNAYRKSAQKMTKKDRMVLEVAIRMKRDYETRTKGGTYYESR